MICFELSVKLLKTVFLMSESICRYA